MNCFHLAIFTSVLALTASSVPAAEFPKSGATKATGYTVGSAVDGDEGWETGSQPELFVMNGVIRNDKEGGPFDKNFLRCIGQYVTIAGKFVTSGTCTETDKAGDKIFMTFNADGFTYIGGTGKYKGITGGGTTKIENVFEGKKGWASIESYEKHWEIK